AEKGQQVMLAQAEKLDVFHHYHFVVADAERRAVQDTVGILVIAAGQEFQRLLVALRSLAQAFALRVFAHELDHLADKISNALLFRDCKIVVKQNFLGRFRHGLFPSGLSRLWSPIIVSPEYSK